jgi:hypothetical protein
VSTSNNIVTVLNVPASTSRVKVSFDVPDLLEDALLILLRDFEATNHYTSPNLIIFTKGGSVL